jgi:hypothetical protein
LQWRSRASRARKGSARLVTYCPPASAGLAIVNLTFK